MIQTKIGIITWAGFAEIKNVLIQFLKLQESSICVFQEFETLIENRYISFLICFNENRIEQFFVLVGCVRWHCCYVGIKVSIILLYFSDKDFFLFPAFAFFID